MGAPFHAGDRMSEERVTPALTAEEWREAVRDVPGTVGEGYIGRHDGLKVRAYWTGELEIEYFANACDGDPRFRAEDRHALGALALHGQPFGFTRQDVAFLVEVQETVSGALRDMAGNPEWGANRFASLIARIEALLPPERRRAANEPRPEYRKFVAP